MDLKWLRFYCVYIIQLLYLVFVSLALQTIIKCFDLIVVFSSHVHLYFLVSLFADNLLSTNFGSHHSKPGEGQKLTFKKVGSVAFGTNRHS